MEDNKRKVLNKGKLINRTMKRGRSINSKKIDEFIKELKLSLKDRQLMKEIKVFVKSTT